MVRSEMGTVPLQNDAERYGQMVTIIKRSYQAGSLRASTAFTIIVWKCVPTTCQCYELEQIISTHVWPSNGSLVLTLFLTFESVLPRVCKNPKISETRPDPKFSGFLRSDLRNLKFYEVKPVPTPTRIFGFGFFLGFLGFLGHSSV